MTSTAQTQIQAFLRLLPIVLGVALALYSFPVIALASAPDQQLAPTANAVHGVVFDAETNKPLAWATVMIVELKRGEITHEDGAFHLNKIPAGNYTLQVSHLGYRTDQRNIHVSPNDTLDITISLAPTVMQGQSIVVSGARDENGRYAATKPAETLSGAALQQSMGRTLAETLGNQPGVAKQSMGPAAARPVVRGLGGDRLTILEDGADPGDLSGMSADHAVSIETASTERIEVLRGPSAFLYSSNALGGVINLVKEKAMTTTPDRLYGTVSAQGETVNAGYTGGFSLDFPAGPLGAHLNGSFRNADDITTPAGNIGNTAITTYDGAAGLSYVFFSGSAGITGGYYDTEYGIPGGFAGGHPGGVTIAMERQQVAAKAELLQDEDFFRRYELQAVYSGYHHEELESNGAVGTEFTLETYTATLTANHDTLGPITRGTVVVRGEHRNLEAFGIGIPTTAQTSVAVVAYEEADAGALTLKGAIRFDASILSPDTTTTNITVTTDRTFTGISGAISAEYPIGEHWHAGATLMRTFRVPTTEELFSNGPHLASYSYEIGNPKLNTETGLNLEASFSYSSESGNLALAVFQNTITGYIYPRNTGDTNVRLLLPIYQQSGADARFVGGELSAEWEALEGVVLNGSASYVQANLIDTDSPLPYIPPLSASASVRYHSGELTTGITARGAAEQTRVGEFEQPTPGYITWDAFAQYRLIAGGTLQSITLTVENITNATYHNHLSRIKTILPEPGRNLRLGYKLYL